jgi:hypothetical protein
LRGEIGSEPRSPSSALSSNSRRASPGISGWWGVLTGVLRGVFWGGQWAPCATVTTVLLRTEQACPAPIARVSQPSTTNRPCVPDSSNAKASRGPQTRFPRYDDLYCARRRTPV